MAPTTTQLRQNGTEISLIVNDERTKNDLGQRTGLGGTIKFNGDMADLVRSSLADRFIRKGFSIAKDHSGQNVLRIDIRQVEYKQTIRFFGPKVGVNVAMKITLTNRSGTYEQFYRVDDRENLMIVPSANQDNERISGAISVVLDKIVGDPSLTQRLYPASQ